MRTEVMGLLQGVDRNIFTPGTLGYSRNLLTAVSWLTSQETLESLPGRGAQGHSLRFVHQQDGSTRLITVHVRAELDAGAAAREALRGRPVAGSLDQRNTVTPEQLTVEETDSLIHQLTFKWMSRFLTQDEGRMPPEMRELRGLLTQRMGGGVTGFTAQAGMLTTLTEATDTSWLRSAAVGDFGGVPFTLVATLTNTSAHNLPTNLPGTLLWTTHEAMRPAWNALTHLLDSGSDTPDRTDTVEMRTPGDTGPTGRNTTRPGGPVTVPAEATLRFIGTRPDDGQRPAGPVDPQVLHRHPARLSDFAGRFDVPQPLAVHAAYFWSFNADGMLLRALREVQPDWSPSRLLSPGNSEGGTPLHQVNVLLASLVADRATRDGQALPSHFSLGTVPGAFPGDGSAGTGATPQVRLSFHNIRHEPGHPGMVIDHMSSRSSSAQSSSAHNRGWQGLWEFRPTKGPGHHGVFTRPVPPPGATDHRHGKAKTTDHYYSNRSALLPGAATDAPATDGAANDGAARGGNAPWVDLSQTVSADLLIEVSGSKGKRWVVGTSRVSLNPQDLLGLGILDAGPHGSDLDLRSALAPRTADGSTLPTDWHQQDRAADVARIAGQVAASVAPGATARLWFSLGRSDSAELPRVLHLAGAVASGAGRPVDLVLRTADGTQHVSFDASGALTRPAGGATHAALATVETHTAAVRADLDAQRAATEHLSALPAARQAVTDTSTALERATRAEATAADALTAARDTAARNDRAAQTAVDRAEAAVTNSRERITRLETQLAQATAAVREAQQQVERAAQQNRGRGGSGAGRRSTDSARLAQRLTTQQTAQADLTRQLDGARSGHTALETTLREATQARDTTANTGRAAVADATTALNTARRDVADRREQHESAEAELTTTLGDLARARSDSDARTADRVAALDAVRQAAAAVHDSIPGLPEPLPQAVTRTTPQVVTRDLVTATLMALTPAAEPPAAAAPTVDLGDRPRRPGAEELTTTVAPPADAERSTTVQRFGRRAPGADEQTFFHANPDGTLVLPDGRPLHPAGWVRYGADFVHDATGTVLRGDTGWIGTAKSLDAFRDATPGLGPDAHHRLVVTDAGLHLVGGDPVRSVFFPFRLPGAAG
ncbi:hypothetical protein [Streptomyces sp. SM14]|nr:hypothetical protein [Streptomyces sp. SM14]